MKESENCGESKDTRKQNPLNDYFLFCLFRGWLVGLFDGGCLWFCLFMSGLLLLFVLSRCCSPFKLVRVSH